MGHLNQRRTAKKPRAPTAVGAGLATEDGQGTDLAGIPESRVVSLPQGARMLTTLPGAPVGVGGAAGRTSILGSGIVLAAATKDRKQDEAPGE